MSNAAIQEKIRKLQEIKQKQKDCSHKSCKKYSDPACYCGCCDEYECSDCGKVWAEEAPE